MNAVDPFACGVNSQWGASQLQEKWIKFDLIITHQLITKLVHAASNKVHCRYYEMENCFDNSALNYHSGYV